MIIEEMTMAEFEHGLKLTKTVYLPFGSVEEHGNHLPLSTDTIEAYEVGKKASKIIPLFVAPPIHYGCCRSTSCHLGTLSISTGTLKSLMKDIIRSMHLNGLMNFLVLTGHAGASHCSALQEAGEELISELQHINIAVVTELDLARNCCTDFIETKNDSHAGEIETSRILHSHPHLVKGTGEKEYPSFPYGILVRDKREFWPNGVWGDPTKATADKGHKIEEILVSKVVELCRRLESRIW